MNDRNLEQTIVNYFNQITYNKYSEEVIDRIKTILLHDLVVGLWGRKSREYTAVSKVYSNKTFLDRVFLEGMAMSARANEDFYGANHFGPLIIPNALHYGIQVNANGKQLLAAIGAGFEMGIFLSDQLGEKVAAKGFRGTPVFGIMAATVAAAHISESSENEMFYALSHAYANAFGISVSLLAGTDEWRYQAALGAYHAAFAYHIAGQGMLGYKPFLTGSRGFAELYADHQTELSLISDDNALSLLKVGVKRYPVHIYVLSPIEAAIQLVRQNGPYHANDITSVNIMVPENQLLPFNMQTGPYENINQAIVSIPTNVAIALIHEEYRAELLEKANHPDVLNIRNKIKIITETKLNAYEAKIEVITVKDKYSVNITHPEELYFPTFKKERNLLIREAKQWGISPECIMELAQEIEHIEKQSSLNNLLNSYERCNEGLSSG